jgi:ubiquinone/menaquinone biosynthesis C-methylase UbiE
MSERDVSAVRRSRVGYLDQAAASRAGRGYKDAMLAEMRLRPGHRVVDLGCGPGTDLLEMAELVGGDGLTIGIDADPVMVAEARRRTSTRANVQVIAGDAHHLVLDEGCMDRVRMDRVAQHLADPAHAFAQVRRVLRPGGLLAVAEPDWDTLVVDDPDVDTSRAYTRFVASQVVLNGAIGRALPRLAVEAHLHVLTVRATTVFYTDFLEGEPILRLASVMSRAVQAGAIGPEAGRQWLHRVSNGPFFAAFTFITVIAQRPVTR